MGGLTYLILTIIWIAIMGIIAVAVGLVISGIIAFIFGVKIVWLGPVIVVSAIIYYYIYDYIDRNRQPDDEFCDRVKTWCEVEEKEMQKLEDEINKREKCINNLSYARIDFCTLKICSKTEYEKISFKIHSIPFYSDRYKKFYKHLTLRDG